jgi:hypothetical protein
MASRRDRSGEGRGSRGSGQPAPHTEEGAGSSRSDNSAFVAHRSLADPPGAVPRAFALTLHARDLDAGPAPPKIKHGNRTLVSTISETGQNEWWGSTDLPGFELELMPGEPVWVIDELGELTEDEATFWGPLVVGGVLQVGVYFAGESENEPRSELRLVVEESYFRELPFELRRELDQAQYIRRLAGRCWLDSQVISQPWFPKPPSGESTSFGMMPTLIFVPGPDAPG